MIVNSRLKWSQIIELSIYEANPYRTFINTKSLVKTELSSLIPQCILLVSFTQFVCIMVVDKLFEDKLQLKKIPHWAEFQQYQFLPAHF